jgi:hypothetical protein
MARLRLAPPQWVFTPVPYPGAGASGQLAGMRSCLCIAVGLSALACSAPAPRVASPLSELDGVIDRVGDHLSGSVTARFTPGSPNLRVVGSVSGRDVRLWFGSDFVFSGTIDDAPDAATGAIGVSGLLIGPDVGPIPEHLTLR